jgi:secondary thiamine-phosphate synthase enzyme
MFRTILSYDTTQKAEVRCITDDLNRVVAAAGVDNGTLLVYSLHTTLGLFIQEAAEPMLCRDFIEHLTGCVKDDGREYHHSCALHPSGTCEDDRYNAPSHIRQMLMNQNIVLDVQGGQMALGQWQDVALFELDGPREGRKLLVKVWSDPPAR